MTTKSYDLKGLFAKGDTAKPSISAAKSAHDKWQARFHKFAEDQTEPTQQQLAKALQKLTSSGNLLLQCLMF